MTERGWQLPGHKSPPPGSPRGFSPPLSLPLSQNTTRGGLGRPRATPSTPLPLTGGTQCHEEQAAPNFSASPVPPAGPGDLPPPPGGLFRFPGDILLPFPPFPSPCVIRLAMISSPSTHLLILAASSFLPAALGLQPRSPSRSPSAAPFWPRFGPVVPPLRVPRCPPCRALPALFRAGSSG